MSRTYRKREERFWYTRERYENDICMHKWYGYRTYDALVAIYYTDAQTGMWQIPKHWKKDFRIRPFRAAEHRALRKEMQAVDYGNVIYPIKKDHDEYYW